MLSHEEVQEILQLLDSTDYQQLTLETDSFKLSLQRAGDDWTAAQEVLTSPTIIETDASNKNTISATPASEVKPTEEPNAGHLHSIHTPLPGVFYRAPKPGAEPFVELGARVEPNTQVCIIESMKLMNAVYAGVHGTVVEICANNGEPVEKQAVILRIEPTIDTSSESATT
jgi:acetyl-CoA carboxylase biotin carboxyl carrier protein